MDPTTRSGLINLAKAGEASPPREPWTHLAVRRGWPDLLRPLVELGVPVDIRDEEGWTALHRAACRDDGAAAVAALLQCGADPDSRIATPAGRRHTPLHLAANVTIVGRLIVGRADYELRDDDGCTPALSAARRGDEAVMMALLEHGANAEARTNEGRGLIELLIRAGKPAKGALMTRLRRRGAPAAS